MMPLKPVPLSALLLAVTLSGSAECGQCGNMALPGFSCCIKDDRLQ